MSRASLTEALIEAQTAYVMEELTTIRRESVAEIVESLLKIAETATLSACIPPALMIDVLTQVRTRVPASVGAGEVVEALLDVAFAGPSRPVTPGELVARDQLEDVLDQLLSHADVLEKVLDDVTSGPLAGAVASRFIGRLIGEVVSANQAVADKVPGLGALVSFGTSAAAKVVSVADKQFEAVLGDTAGRGAAVAVRKLNAVAIDVVRDPNTREAILEIWDRVAERPIIGLEGKVDRDEASELADALRAMIATASDAPPVADLDERIVTSVYVRYGDLPVAELINDFDVDRELLVDHLHVVAVAACAAALQTDQVEALVRTRVEAFYTRPDIQALLTTA